MASIKKLPSGKWLVRYRDPNGRPRSKTCDTKTAAQRWIELNGADMQRGDWIDPKLRRTKFDEFAQQWWETTVDLRPTTRRAYDGLLQRHVLPFFTGRPVVAIDFMDVETFIAGMLNSGLSRKYTREAVSVLREILKLPVATGVRRDNPADGHKLKTRQRKIRVGDVLDADQAKRLVAHVRHPYQAAVWLLILTGIRPSEMCGLRIRNVDLIRRVVAVRESLVPVPTFDNNPRHLAVGPTKTEAGDRDIPIPLWLCEMIAEVLADRSRALGRPLNGDEYVFVNKFGRPLSVQNFRQHVMVPALVAAGFSPTFRTYDLRHSHASLLIALGADVLNVAHRMGHSDPSVTLRVYGHLFEGAQEKLTDQLDAAVQKAEAITERIFSLDDARQQTADSAE